jgi:hypothetical protein
MGSSALLPLDPETLGDPGGGVRVELGNAIWTVSGDGMTLVQIEYARHTGGRLPPEEVTIVVRDGLTGGERARFHPPEQVAFPHLSEDGARLVVQTGQDMGDPRPTTWYVLDTTDGRPLATARSGEVGWHQVWLDPGARRLYQLVTANPAAGGIANTRPLPIRIVAHDLTTGEEAGRLDLPEVLGGIWQTERSAQGFPVMAELRPGIALSPDGRRLAIVHADAELLTLVDAERLAIERTIPLAHPVNLLERLGLAPRVARAKVVEGATRRAVFAPDGRRLYVHGVALTADDGGQPAERGLGLLAVELERGAVLAAALPDARLAGLAPAPDGRSVYAFGSATAERGDIRTAPSQLWRLHGDSLAILAERQFTGPHQLLVRPTGRSHR